MPPQKFYYTSIKPIQFLSKFYWLMMQVARQRHDPGKGCYWAINPLHSQEKVQPFEKRKKPVVVAGLEPAMLQRTLLQAAQCCRPGTAGLQHCQLPPPLPLLGTTQHTHNN